MSKHKETGIKGEHIAENFLLKKGYKILHTNWRWGRKEVDIIAEKGDMVVMVEVKTRRNFQFGFPEEAVTQRKRTHLKELAVAFFEANNQYQNVRFDIVSVILKGREVVEIVHFEDAFY
ncbi:MAG: YraN family protein [Flavipsychrobacter sp.]|nr:YraN family protein [Flavipsychrobacter sp.]